jgi:hypothetical protein
MKNDHKYNKIHHCMGFETYVWVWNRFQSFGCVFFFNFVMLLKWQSSIRIFTLISRLTLCICEWHLKVLKTGKKSHYHELLDNFFVYKCQQLLVTKLDAHSISYIISLTETFTNNLVQQTGTSSNTSHWHLPQLHGLLSKQVSMSIFKCPMNTIV